MMAYVPVYPYSCAPADLMASVKANERRYFYSDVHVRGNIPTYVQKYWAKKGITIEITPEEQALLKREPLIILGSAITCQERSQPLMKWLAHQLRISQEQKS